MLGSRISINFSNLALKLKRWPQGGGGALWAKTLLVNFKLVVLCLGHVGTAPPPLCHLYLWAIVEVIIKILLCIVDWIVFLFNSLFNFVTKWRYISSSFDASKDCGFISCVIRGNSNCDITFEDVFAWGFTQPGQVKFPKESPEKCMIRSLQFPHTSHPMACASVQEQSWKTLPRINLLHVVCHWWFARSKGPSPRLGKVHTSSEVSHKRTGALEVGRSYDSPSLQYLTSQVSNFWRKGLLPVDFVFVFLPVL